MKKLKKIISLSIVMAILLGISPTAMAAVPTSFTDVQSGSTYETAINALAGAEIILGTGNGKFSPDQTVTRAMAITVLGRMAKAEQKDTDKFSDVANGSWYSGYVGWASDNGIVVGDDEGLYMPNQAVTGEQMELILTRYAKLNGLRYTASNTSKEPLTRGELAQMVYKIYQLECVTVRKTSNGPVQGYVDTVKHATAWKGVPYGHAERWAAPTAPKAWTDPLVCIDSKTGQLPQGASGTFSGDAEDLMLDIYAPEDVADSSALPVLVYIHGGNNQSGLSDEICGETLVNGAGCVFVSLNYRLGALGFNPLPALQTGSALTDSGNYTLLDIACALDWVKANIAEFGGDPDNVTLAGFSAGGRDVMATLISPIFEGKYDKAISFSGGMTVSDPEDAIRVFANKLAPLAVADGKKPSEADAYEWLKTNGADVREWLYSLSDETLATLFGDAGIRMALFPHLYTDGTVLPKDGFDTKNYNDVPLMMISGTDELSTFAGFGNYQDEMTQYAGGKLYEWSNTEASAVKLSGNGYTSNMYYLANDYGHDILSNVYGLFWGSFHGVFIPLVDRYSQTYTRLGVGFGVQPYDTPAAMELSEALCAYIGNFIRTGNPNGSDTVVEWTSWQAEGVNALYFGTATDKADIRMVDRHISYDEVIEYIENYDGISEEQKDSQLKNVLNGRWFSQKLDEHFGTPSLWITD